MDNDQKMIVKNIQIASNPHSIAPSLSVRGKEKINKPILVGSQANNLTKKRGRLNRIKENKKLLKEKIDRLKMITNSINRITVK